MASTEFPKWKYHEEFESLVVHTPEQEKILGAQWKDSPSDFGKETCPAVSLTPKPKMKVVK